jgi:hypothetical protein
MNQNVIKAFHLMWGDFPEPVLLVKKNHDILAVNKVGNDVGLPVEIKCSSIGNLQDHEGCLAQQAFKLQRAVSKKVKTKDGDKISYWIPLAEYPDICIHFGISIVPQ